MNIKKLPNILTVLRALLVPVFMVLLIFSPFPTDTVTRVVSAGLFALISLTDMLDGMIARKYNAISDFGKFLDPIADKLLVIGGMLSLMIFYMERMGEHRGYYLFSVLTAFSLFIVVARELAVTSLRLICKSSEGTVIAANMAGKVKTVSQIIFILAACLEPIFMTDSLWISYLALAVMTFMTIYSGVKYFMIYLPLMKKNRS